jgi:hypothetical protein
MVGMASRWIRREEGVRMKRTPMMGALLAVLVLMGALTATGGQMPMGGQGGAQEPSAGPSSMMGRGMMGMMCPMMGGQMDPMAMMGMMSMMGGEMDPKTMARMLEFRGDLLKAMGEVMLKHAKAMEGGQ